MGCPCVPTHPFIHSTNFWAPFSVGWGNPLRLTAKSTWVAATMPHTHPLQSSREHFPTGCKVPVCLPYHHLRRVHVFCAGGSTTCSWWCHMCHGMRNALGIPLLVYLFLVLNIPGSTFQPIPFSKCPLSLPYQGKHKVQNDCLIMWCSILRTLFLMNWIF